MEIRRITLDELRTLVKAAEMMCIPVVNYVRHESTVKLLSLKLGLPLEPNSSLYKYEHGDMIVIIGLKNPARGKEVEVTAEDLDIAIAKLTPLP